MPFLTLELNYSQLLTLGHSKHFPNVRINAHKQTRGEQALAERPGTLGARLLVDLSLYGNPCGIAMVGVCTPVSTMLPWE